MFTKDDLLLITCALVQAQATCLAGADAANSAGNTRLADYLNEERLAYAAVRDKVNGEVEALVRAELQQPKGGTHSLLAGLLAKRKEDEHAQNLIQLGQVRVFAGAPATCVKITANRVWYTCGREKSWVSVIAWRRLPFAEKANG